MPATDIPHRDAKRYSIMSALALLFVIVAPVCSWFAVQTDFAAVRAIGVLLTPFALFAWIFTTIRALHMRDIDFWMIPSTYVAFFGGLLAAACLFVSMFFLHDSPKAVSQSFNSGVVQGPEHHGDYTILIAAVIVEVGTVLWCWWYNWRKTEAAILAISVTALQTGLGAGLVVLIWIRFGSGGGHRVHECSRSGRDYRSFEH